MESITREIAKDIQQLNGLLRKRIELTHPAKDRMMFMFEFFGGLLVLFAFIAKSYLTS